MLTEEEIIEYNKIINQKCSKTKNSNVKDIKNILIQTLLSIDLDRNMLMKILSHFVYTREKLIETSFLNGALNYNDFEDLLRINYKVVGLVKADIYLNDRKYLDLILNCGDNRVYDALPTKIRKLPEVQERFKRKQRIYFKDGFDRNGYDINWRNNDGKLKEYFKLFNDIEIKSKEEYYYIVQKYHESGLNKHEFCEKYGISNFIGFSSLLNKTNKENTDIASIELENSQVNKKSTLKKIVQKINANKLSFNDYFENYYSKSHSIDTMLESVTNEEKATFLDKFMEYVFEYEFNLEFSKILTLFELENNFSPTSIRNFMIRKTLRYVSGKNKQKMNNVIIKICAYITPYDETTKYSFMIDNKQVEANSKDIDNTIAYITDNNIYLCEKTFRYYLKKFVSKELTYDERTKELREEAETTFINLLYKNISIREYFEVVDSYEKINA